MIAWNSRTASAAQLGYFFPSVDHRRSRQRATGAAHRRTVVEPFWDEPVSPQAFRSYVAAAHCATRPNARDLRAALAHVDEACALDPSFLPAQILRASLQIQLFRYAGTYKPRGGPRALPKVGSRGASTGYEQGAGRMGRHSVRPRLGTRGSPLLGNHLRVTGFWGLGRASQPISRCAGASPTPICDRRRVSF